MKTDPFETGISRRVWQSRYRLQGEGMSAEESITDSWRRLARTLAAGQQGDAGAREERFFSLLSDFRFLPGGRILAGAGADLDVTLFNCFVMGTIGDSLQGICDGLGEGALTMQQGGGVGYDFSTLRPAGAAARRVGSLASGPVSFMRVWDSMCATLVSSAQRRGAMMATLRCDHPDIENFVDAKRDASQLRNFNLSVLVSDDFMRALDEDAPWQLVFPAASLGGAEANSGLEVVRRCWSGSNEPVSCLVLKTISARELWERIMRAAYDSAEPGVLFVDRINRENNLGYRETISATNPCGEIPLPPYGACNLGSINLTRFVKRPFEAGASLDFEALDESVRIALRMLNRVIDVSRFPLPAQAEQARGTRRVGLGITGLADALIMLGLHYADAAARALAAEAMRRIRDSAYLESIALARSDGPFPFFERDAYLGSAFVERLPEPIRGQIYDYGIRNSHLTAIAPAGTISLLANNISSGIEPVFDFRYRRRIRDDEGNYSELETDDYAWRLWQRLRPGEDLPGSFVSARELPPRAHLEMQAALQPYVDSAVSKTINVPADFEFSAFEDIYHEAYRLGLKGCTTFRPNDITGSVLSEHDKGLPIEAETGCCNLERENG
ncbi:MAG: adenosylcobalamin-dependent ribonucleoside-diphosphate reductase [Gammaproteobacteria bacterium]|jgi:ribonucleoside-diphosphate reductase alpha chain